MSQTWKCKRKNNVSDEVLRKYVRNHLIQLTVTLIEFMHKNNKIHVYDYSTLNLSN